MQNSSNSYGPGSTRRTALICLAMVGVMLAGILGLWWKAAMRTPMVDIPIATLPNPNAFDFYVKASNAIVSDQEIGKASGTQPTLVLSLAQREALVQQNLGTISTLHQGFAYPYASPEARSMYTQFPYFAKFRGMARLLSLQGKVRSDKGDWSGAVESYLDAVQLGEEIPHGSTLIGYLVGVACQSIGRRPMWGVVDHLNAAQSRAAATRLVSVIDHHFSFADTMQEEKWLGQSTLIELFNSPKETAAVLNPDAGKDLANATGNGSPPAFAGVLFYLTHSKSRIMHDYTIWMDKSIQIARQPYGLHLSSPPLPTDPINEVMLSAFSQAQMKEVNSETQNRLLLMMLALHAYQLEHGRYPASLHELAPTYLQKLPNDPFAAQGTFLYRVQGKSYVLYSVGPDGKDDGGTPIDDPSKATSSNPNARYRINDNSVGDIVAGKNIY